MDGLVKMDVRISSLPKFVSHVSELIASTSTRDYSKVKGIQEATLTKLLELKGEFREKATPEAVSELTDVMAAIIKSIKSNVSTNDVFDHYLNQQTIIDQLVEFIDEKGTSDILSQVSNLEAIIRNVINQSIKLGKTNSTARLDAMQSLCTAKGWDFGNKFEEHKPRQGNTLGSNDLSSQDADAHPEERRNLIIQQVERWSNAHNFDAHGIYNFIKHWRSVISSNSDPDIQFLEEQVLKMEMRFDNYIKQLIVTIDADPTSAVFNIAHSIYKIPLAEALKNRILEVQGELDKLNNGCLNHSHPIENFHERLNSIANSKVVSAVKGSFFSSLVTERRWLVVANHGNLCEDLIKDLSSTIEVNLDKLSNLWTTPGTRTDRAPLYRNIGQVWDSIRNIYATCFNTNEGIPIDVTVKKRIENHFESLKNRTNNSIDMVLKKIKTDYLKIETEKHSTNSTSNHSEFKTVFSSLSALFYCFEDANEISSKEDSRERNFEFIKKELTTIKREDIVKRKGECCENLKIALTELSKEWVEDFQTGPQDEAKKKLLAHRLITLHMLEQEVNVIPCSHVGFMFKQIIKDWQSIESAVGFIFLEMDKDATLQPLAGSLRTNHPKYFGMYLTEQRNKKTQLVTIDEVVANLEGADDKASIAAQYRAPIAPKLLKELYKLFRLEWEKSYENNIDNTRDDAIFYGVLLREQHLLNELEGQIKQLRSEIKNEQADKEQLESKIKQEEELRSTLKEIVGNNASEEAGGGNDLSEKEKRSEDVKILHDKKGTGEFVPGCAVKKLHGKRNLFTLCVKLFALWSLVKTKGHGAENYTKLSESTVTPHVIQVLAVFRLLGFGDADDKDKNLEGFLAEEFNIYKANPHFLEVLTGEGKSIVVAITAAILAVMGNDVHCMCYSAYLSERDKNDFNEIFEMLSIRGIQWDTYENHCERILSGEVSMRDRIRHAVLRPEPGEKRREAKAPAGAGGLKIVIIDETDTLWNFKTYQKEYVALANIKLDNLIHLTDLIWDNQKLPLYDLVKTVHESTELQECASECVEKFVAINDNETRWKDLIMGCARSMIRDLYLYKDFPYKLDSESGKLYCEENHGVTNAMRHGYKTMWHAYDHHHNQGNSEIRGFKRDEYIVLNIIGAKIAYARIYKEYDLVLALTGTLCSMHKSEIDHIKRELNPRFTYMPSSFQKKDKDGIQELDTRVTLNTADHHRAISDCALNRVKSQDQAFGPICILFETDEDLNKFSGSDACKSLTQRGFEDNILRANSSEIDAQISKITKLSTLTLMTEPFARGIDPRVADDRVKILGVLLIQTYISRTDADETQAKGRVGRQDEKGYYALIINIEPFIEKESDSKKVKDKDGSYFKFEPSEIEDLQNTTTMQDDNERKKKIKEVIKEVRNRHHEAAFKEAIEEVAKTTESDEKGKEFIKKLISVTRLQSNSQSDENDLEKEKKADTLKEVLDFVQVMNNCVVDNTQEVSGKHVDVFRLVLCVDATGSMAQGIKAVGQAIQEIVEKTKTQLDSQGVDKEYMINIVAYRNYDVSIKSLIEYTGFKRPAELKDLKEFLSELDLVDCKKEKRLNIDRRGGEAVEAALAYANTLECSAVMVAGDAPPMPPESVRVLRKNGCGESYWQDKERPAWIHQPTDYIEQAEKFCEKGIPIHTFGLHSEYKSPFKCFREISQITNGKAIELKDSETETASQQMATAITRTFLEDVDAEKLIVTGEAAKSAGFVENPNT